MAKFPESATYKLPEESMLKPRGPLKTAKEPLPSTRPAGVAVHEPTKALVNPGLVAFMGPNLRTKWLPVSAT